MSRSYEMTAELTGYVTRRKAAIVRACKAEWEFDHVEEYNPGTLTLWGYSQLTGGESDQEFARRVAHAVWQANRGGCRVTVRATCMENLPNEEYVFHGSQYRRPRPRPRTKKGKR